MPIRAMTPPGPYGNQLLPDLFVVSWLGMTPGQIDCHVFVLRSPQGLLLIDCGTPWGHARLLENLAHWGLDPRRVRTVLLTHAHVDHCAGGAHFKEYGAEILAHRELLSAIECQWEATGALAPDGRGWRLDGALRGGETLRRGGFDVRVLHTPGHTRGCLSFVTEVNGARCLFSGDLLMHDGLPGWHGDPGFSVRRLVASLRRLTAEDFAHLCFGHGAILDDRGSLFRRALAGYEHGAWTAPGTRLRVPVTGRRRPHPA